MSETDRPIAQKQNRLIWEGFQVFRKWAECMCVALSQGLERDDHIFVCGYSLPVSQNLKVK
jgi:hypothetical protein